MINRNGNEDLELFKRALSEGLAQRIEKEEQKMEELQITFSKRHEIRMNVIFYEQFGDAFIPFPDEK